MMAFTILATLLLATLTSSSVIQPSSDGTFELLILHNNDMHARFEQTSQLSGTCTIADRDAGKCYGGFPRVAHVIKEARRAAATGQGPPVLYLNAGDTYTGTVWFTLYKWKIAAEFINALQPDAISLGNHEFDEGVAGLIPFIENVTCPVLAANLEIAKVPEMKKLRNLMPSITFSINSTKIGIVGYLTPDTKILAKGNNVEYTDEIEALTKEVAKLKNDGVKLIIALGHSGYRKDLQIAREVEGLDLVIGGHTNTFLWNGTAPDAESPQGPYPTYVIQATGKSVPVVQAFAYTKYLGKLLMAINSDGNIISLDGKPILLDNSIPQDQETLKIIKRYENNNIGNEVVGVTTTVLDATSCSFEECNIGNLIADSMVYQYASNYSGDHWTDAPIGIIQAGGIRSSIVQSERKIIIKERDLLGVLPFGGNLVVVSMNGSILFQMLEHSVFRYEFQNLEAIGEFLQFSGMKVQYNIKNSVGSRVVDASARCSKCKIIKYDKVEKDNNYKVIMPYFIFSGGDGYIMFKDLPYQNLTSSELISTRFYVKKYSPIYPELQGRISFVEYSTASAYFIHSSTRTLLIGLMSYFYLLNKS